MFSGYAVSEAKKSFLIQGSIEKRLIIIGENFIQYDEPAKHTSLPFTT